MHKTNKKNIVIPIFLSLLSLSIVCSSCAILPVENEILPPPVIKSGETKTYNFATVTQGDLIKYQSISTQYIPAVSVDSAFTITGELIESVEVKTGDTVTAGQVLAFINTDQIESQRQDAEFQLQQTMLRLEHLDETKTLQLKDISADKEYLTQRDALMSDIEIGEIQLAELKRQKEVRILTSPIDGTVTYVKKIKDGDRSEADERLVVVTDKSLSVFKVSADDAKFLTLGETVSIKIGSDTYYDATVISAEELNVPEEARNLGYLRMDDVSATIAEGTYGSIRIPLEQRTDILYIPKQAVTVVGEKQFVYIMENNIKATRDVELGLEAEGLVEVTKGLKVGENVILGESR